MKKPRIKFLVFLMAFAMLWATLVLPAQAVVNKYGYPNGWDSNGQYWKNFDALTVSEIGGTDKLSAATGYTVWAGGSTVDITSGAKDAIFGTDPTVKANYWSIGNVTDNNNKSGNGADFAVFYANDGEYLYAYMETTLPTSKATLDTNDLARFYIDFHNQHEYVYYTNANTYQNRTLYDSSTAKTKNGGQFEFKASTNTKGTMKRGANNWTFTAGTDFQFYYNYKDGTTLSKTYDSTKDIDGYVLKVRIAFPEYVKTAISKNQRPVISIGYEVRNNVTEPKYDMHYYDASDWSSTKKISDLTWCDYTVNPDIVLACADATKEFIADTDPADVRGKTITLDGAMTAEEGWSEVPFGVLDNVASGGTYNLTEAPKYYVAADSYNIYIYVTGPKKFSRVWVNLGVDTNVGKNVAIAETTDKHVQIQVRSDDIKDYKNNTWIGTSSNANMGGSANWYKESTAQATTFSKTEVKVNAGYTSVEVKIPMSDAVRDRIFNNQYLNLGVFARYNNDALGLSDTFETFHWGDKSGMDRALYIPSTYLVDRTVADVTANAVNIDGVKNASEGWSKNPYSILDGKQGSTAKITGQKPVPEVYLSADSDNIYLFVDAKQDICELYTLVQLDSAYNANSDTTEAGDRMMEIRFSGKGGRADYAGVGESWSAPVIDYQTQDGYAFSDSEFFIDKSNPKTFEARIPIPEWVKEELRKGDFTFKMGFLVRTYNSAVTTTPKYDYQLVDGEYNFNWDNGVIPVTLKKSDANATLSVEGVQSRKAATKGTDVRFIAALNDDIANFDEVGFELTMIEGSNKIKTVLKSEKLYAKLVSGDGYVVAGEGDYADAKAFFCFTLGELADGDHSFEVRAYTSKKGTDSKLYSYRATVTVTVADGVITVA